MANSRFEFVGIRKNGAKATEVVTAININVAQSLAKKKLKTILQTRVLPNQDESGEQSSVG